MSVIVFAYKNIYMFLKTCKGFFYFPIFFKPIFNYLKCKQKLNLSGYNNKYFFGKIPKTSRFLKTYRWFLIR